MVKRVLAFLGLALLLPCFALADNPIVVDDAALFTAQEESRIEEKAQEIIDCYQVDVVVVTSYSPKRGRSQDFADDYYDENGYGIGDDDAGILYLIDMSNRVPTISTKGVMIDYITDARLEELFDCSYDALADGEYGTSALQLLERLEDFMAEGIREGSFRYDSETGERLTGVYNALTKSEIVFATLCGLAAAAIVIGVVVYRYKLLGNTYNYNLNKQTEFDEAKNRETYLRSTVVRRPKPQIQSSGSGRGGGGSRVHSSFGGRHGGGSGRGF